MPSTAPSSPALPAATEPAGLDTTEQRRLYELDLFRFIAAAVVVAFHLTFLAGQTKHGGPSFPTIDAVTRFGYLGVEFFFMLSGFVILMSAGRGTSTRRFLAGRAARIYPAYWVGVAATSTVVALGGSGYGFDRIAANLTMLQPMLGHEHIDGVYWSLIVEFRFYALVAAVLALGLHKHVESLLAGWLIYAVLRLGIEPPHILDAALLGKHSHYFIAGATFYLIWSDRRVTAQRVLVLGGTWALAMGYVGSYANTLSNGYDTSFSATTTRAVATSFFVILAIVTATGIPQLQRRWFRTIGALTYPLYLLHQVIGYEIYRLWGGPKWLMLATLVVGLLVASHLIATKIEAPAARAVKARIPDSW